MPFRSALLLIALALASVPTVASAQATEAPTGATELSVPPGERPRAEDFETARTVATGLGLRAGSMGTTAVITNPANLPLSQQYHLEAFIQYIPGSGGVSFGSVVADSSTSRVRAGVASRGIYGAGDRAYRGTDQRIALGTSLGEAIGIGISGRYLRLRAKDRTNDGYAGSLEIRRLTLDAAVRVTPLEGLHIAALGYGLIRTKSVLAPTQIGGSVVYQLRSILQIGGDFVVDLTSFSRTTVLWGAGLEWWVADRYPIRLGYRRDHGRDLHALSLGVGFVERAYGVELSLRQELGPYRESVLYVSARYALDVQPVE